MSAQAGPDHERWADAAGAHLLGALPDDERSAFEAHLAACAACREEVAELAVAADALPASALPLVAPPELKLRIMAVVQRDAALLAAAGPEADRPARPAPERPRRLRWAFGLPRAAVLATAAALLVGLLAGIAADRLAGPEGRTVTAAVDPAQAPGARAELEIRDGRATLVARGLPAPPAGRVYQVWLKRPGAPPEPTPALFLPSRDGTATTAVPGSLDGIEQVLVTHEPAGGSRAPTRDPVLTARTAS